MNIGALTQEYKWKWSSQLWTNLAVTNKAQKKFWGSNRIRTHDLRDTGAMLYQLSYKASLEADQVQVQFVPIIWREWHDVYVIKIIWVHCR